MVAVRGVPRMGVWDEVRKWLRDEDPASQKAKAEAEKAARTTFAQRKAAFRSGSRPLDPRTGLPLGASSVPVPPVRNPRMDYGYDKFGRKVAEYEITNEDLPNEIRLTASMLMLLGVGVRYARHTTWTGSRGGYGSGNRTTWSVSGTILPDSGHAAIERLGPGTVFFSLHSPNERSALTLTRSEVGPSGDRNYTQLFEASEDADMEGITRLVAKFGEFLGREE